MTRTPTKPRKAVGVKAVKVYGYTDAKGIASCQLALRTPPYSPEYSVPMTVVLGHIGKDFRIVPIRTARGRKK